MKNKSQQKNNESGAKKTSLKAQVKKAKVTTPRLAANHNETLLAK